MPTTTTTGAVQTVNTLAQGVKTDADGMATQVITIPADLAGQYYLKVCLSLPLSLFFFRWPLPHPSVPRKFFEQAVDATSAIFGMSKGVEVEKAAATRRVLKFGPLQEVEM